MEKVVIGRGTRPLICTPLTGSTRERLLAELAEVAGKRPDIIEWRADFFAAIADSDQVIAMAGELKSRVGGMPVIFTIRSAGEGGNPSPLTGRQAVELTAAVGRETAVEYLDCELSNTPGDIGYLRTVAAGNGKLIIGSFHDFARTPSREALLATIEAAERQALDVAKVAVMPRSMEDVLMLLDVTLAAKRRFTIPLITMSMGELGAVTRLVGGLFGSSLTFAVGAESSAPGQVPIEDLRTVLAIIGRTAGSDGPPG